MYVSNQTLKYFCRKCCNKIPAEKLENVARNQLQKYFGQPELIAEHLQEAGRNLAEKSALLDTHRREIVKVKDEMRQTHQLYLDRQISGEGFRDLFAPAEARKKQLESELPKLEADVDFLKVNQLSAEDVLGESLPLYKRWPNLPPGEKRQIVEALIEKVVIGDGRIDISYSGVPSSVDSCKNLQRLSDGRG